MYPPRPFVRLAARVTDYFLATLALTAACDSVGWGLSLEELKSMDPVFPQILVLMGWMFVEAALLSI